MVEFPTVRANRRQSNVVSNPQDLASKDVFVRHFPLYTDSFLLYLKAVMLFGRVTDYNTRTNLRGPQLKNSNPFSAPGFKELDQLVCVDFLQSIPPEFKNLGFGDHATGVLDTDLYMVHLVPHAYVLGASLSPA